MHLFDALTSIIVKCCSYMIAADVDTYDTLREKAHVEQETVMVAEPDYQYGADAFEVYEQTKGSSEKVLEVKALELKKDEKSKHKECIEQNFDISDFTLSKDDMEQIAKLDVGHSEIIDHSSPMTAKLFGRWRIHD